MSDIKEIKKIINNAIINGLIPITPCGGGGSNHIDEYNITGSNIPPNQNIHPSDYPQPKK